MLRRMRDLVRTSEYVLTVHGADEVEADGEAGTHHGLRAVA
jgi:hypothetical protein